MLTIPLFKISLISSLIPPSSWNILVTIVLSSVSDQLLASSSLSIFLEVSPVLYSEACVFVSTFRLALWVCSVSWVDLPWLAVPVGWPYVGGVLWDPGVLQECPWGELCGSPCYNRVLITMARSCMGWTLRLADCEAQHGPQFMSCWAGADHTEWNSPQ